MLTLLMLLQFESGFCQGTQNPKQNTQEISQSVTTDQTLLIKKILSVYNASNLTDDDAKAIQNKFRESGIHAGPDNNNAITAAGFDPEKLRKLAPPPSTENKVRSRHPSLDERLIIVDEKICTPFLCQLYRRQQ
jgi:hypothetical protein